MDGVIAIVRTDIKQGVLTEHQYEAKRFATEEEGNTMCSSKTNEKIIGFCDEKYEVLQGAADYINHLDNEERIGVESNLQKIIETVKEEKKEQQP
jgi:hypothetical protein